MNETLLMFVAVTIGIAFLADCIETAAYRRRMKKVDMGKKSKTLPTF